VEAPVLETPRLILRAHRVTDFKDSAALWADEAVVKYIGGGVSSDSESWGRLIRYAGTWPLLGYGYWAVERKSDHHFVGEIGFNDFHRDISPSMDGIPEAGWVLSPSVCGQGYATEAVLKVHQWFDEHTEYRRTACIIEPGNKASIRVAEKAGYANPVLTDSAGKPILQWTRSI